MNVLIAQLNFISEKAKLSKLAQLILMLVFWTVIHAAHHALLLELSETFQVYKWKEMNRWMFMETIGICDFPSGMSKVCLKSWKFFKIRYWWCGNVAVKTK